MQNMSSGELVESLINFTETELDACLKKLETRNQAQAEELRDLANKLDQLSSVIHENFSEELLENELEKEEEEVKGIELSRKLKRIFFNDHGLPQLNVSRDMKSKVVAGIKSCKNRQSPMTAPLNIITPEFLQKGGLILETPKKNESNDYQEEDLELFKNDHNEPGLDTVKPLDQGKSVMRNTSFNKTPSNKQAAEAFFKEIGVKPVSKIESGTKFHAKASKSIEELMEENKLALSYKEGHRPKSPESYSRTGAWGIGVPEMRPSYITSSEKRRNEKKEETPIKFNYHYLFSKK